MAAIGRHSVQNRRFGGVLRLNARAPDGDGATVAVLGRVAGHASPRLNDRYELADVVLSYVGDLCIHEVMIGIQPAGKHGQRERDGVASSGLKQLTPEIVPHLAAPSNWIKPETF